MRTRDKGSSNTIPFLCFLILNDMKKNLMKCKIHDGCSVAPLVMCIAVWAYSCLVTLYICCEKFSWNTQARLKSPPLLRTFQPPWSPPASSAPLLHPYTLDFYCLFTPPSTASLHNCSQSDQQQEH